MGGQPGREPPPAPGVLWGVPPTGPWALGTPLPGWLWGVCPPALGARPERLGVPLSSACALGVPSRMAVGSSCIGGVPPGAALGGPPSSACALGVVPRVALESPLLRGSPPGWVFGCPQQSSVLWGLPQSTLVSPCLGTPPGMALKLPPRSTRYCGVPPAMPPVCGAPPVLPWGRATPTMHPPHLALELGLLGGPLDKQQDPWYSRPPKRARRSPGARAPVTAPFPALAQAHLAAVRGGSAGSPLGRVFTPWQPPKGCPRVVALISSL